MACFNESQRMFRIKNEILPSRYFSFSRQIVHTISLTTFTIATVKIDKKKETKRQRQPSRTWFHNLSERDHQLNGVCVWLDWKRKSEIKNPTSSDINRKICPFSLHRVKDSWLRLMLTLDTRYMVTVRFALIHIYSDLSYSFARIRFFPIFYTIIMRNIRYYCIMWWLW